MEIMQTHPVLFVTFTGHEPRAALARAAAIAERFDAPLLVLLVTYEVAASDHDDEAWFESALPRAIQRRYVRTTGPLIHEAIHHARLHHARIVVLSSDVGQSGSCVTALATSADVPVLVARETTSGDAVIAGTDLHDTRFPVLQMAADMIDNFDTRLVGVHNLEPGTTAAELTQRRTELATALDAITFAPELVIDCAVDPADAVLLAARERDADLVVVGAPPRAWLDSLLHPTVAARVVTSARRSVLVTPIHPD
jgi:nucleotide-binding universal stress UspA family protein